VAKVRKDLIPAYGSRNLNLDESVSLKFSEAVNDELRGLDVLDKDRVGKAYRAAVARNPRLAPLYGTRALR
jgi:hypothetical protein